MAGAVTARVYLLPERALEQVFPGSEVQRQSIYLSEAEQSQLAMQGGGDAGRFFTAYLARRQGRLEGIAFFDTHRVRTKEQTLCIAVAPGGRILQVRIISFFEPTDFLPPQRWLDLFRNRTRADSLQPGSDLPAITGATMTSTASARAVRRALWLYDLLRSRGIDGL